MSHARCTCSVIILYIYLSIVQLSLFLFDANKINKMDDAKLSTLLYILDAFVRD